MLLAHFNQLPTGAHPTLPEHMPSSLAPQYLNQFNFNHKHSPAHHMMDLEKKMYAEALQNQQLQSK